MNALRENWLNPPEWTRTSDVDILIEFSPGRHTFDNFMDVSLLLEDVLGRNVDLVTRESLSPYIGPHILREVQRVAILATGDFLPL